MISDSLNPADASQTYYWVGPSTGLWSDPANWGVGPNLTPTATAPSASDDVAIVRDQPDRLTVTGAGACNTLSATGPVIFAGDITATTFIDQNLETSQSLSTSPQIVAGGILHATDAFVSGDLWVDGGSLVVADTLQTGPENPAPYSGGLLTVVSGASVKVGKFEDEGGNLAVDAKSSFEVGNAGIAAAGSFTVDTGAIAQLGGSIETLSASIVNNGLIEIGTTSGNAVSAIFMGDLSGSGHIQLDGGAKLAFSGGNIAANELIQFSGRNASLTLALADTGVPVFEGFEAGDSIQFSDIVRGTSVTLNGTQSATLTVDVYTGASKEYTFLGDYTDRNFTVTTAGDFGPSTITVSETVACFLPGTRIATEDGEVSIESLSIGDFVRTASGALEPVLWIGRRRYDRLAALSRLDLQPIQIARGAFGAGLPRRDLFVSPKHAVLVGDVLVPAELLVNGISFKRAIIHEAIEYLHVELRDHSLLLAEGAPVESFVDDDSRSMFDNADEYAALYPGRLSQPPVWCVPRVEYGDALAAARRRTEMLAGLGPQRALGSGVGPLHGCFDGIEGNVVQGWAWCPDYPTAPILLEIVVDGATRAQVLANCYRSDLVAAGVGGGCHGFRLTLDDLPARANVTVRRAIDGYPLSGPLGGDVRRAA